MAARYLFALDLIASSLPPEKNSGRDVALLRAANLALQRQRDGTEDYFLFLIYGACDQAPIEEALRAYGFPACEVEFVAEDEELTVTENGRMTLSGDYGTDVGRALNRWVLDHHQRALPLGNILTPDQKALAAYSEIEWWWIGYEATATELPWPFEPEGVGTLLPKSHASRATTWLEVLAQGLELDDDDLSGLPYDTFEVQAKVAALCEWLHGFEAASGNGYNDFEPTEATEALGMDPMFIGYKAVDVLGSSNRTRPDEAETAEEALRNAILLITEGARSAVLSALGVFGGDGSLFWTLYSSIWPRYDCRLDEAVEGLLGLAYVDYAEIEVPWQFIRDGWHETADAA